MITHVNVETGLRWTEDEPQTHLDAAEILDAERAKMKCSSLQGKIALGEYNWAKVYSLVNDTNTPFALRVSITSAVEWKRLSQTVDGIAWAAGMSDTDVDDMFRVAMSIAP